jgi:hypothetical protein
VLPHIELAKHEVGHRVAVVRLEKLTGRYPGVLRVMEFHLLAVVVVTTTFLKLNGLSQFSDLMLLAQKVATLKTFGWIRSPIEPIVNEFSLQQLI